MRCLQFSHSQYFFNIRPYLFPIDVKCLLYYISHPLNKCGSVYFLFYPSDLFVHNNIRVPLCVYLSHCTICILLVKAVHFTELHFQNFLDNFPVFILWYKCENQHIYSSYSPAKNLRIPVWILTKIIINPYVNLQKKNQKTKKTAYLASSWPPPFSPETRLLSHTFQLIIQRQEFRTHSRAGARRRHPLGRRVRLDRSVLLSPAALLDGTSM